MINFLSTTDWLKFQEFLERKTWRFDDLFSANLIKHNIKFGKNYLYVPAGPVLNDEKMTPTEALNSEPIIRSELIKLGKELKNIAERENSIYIKVEPQSDYIAKNLVKAGFKRSIKTIQPHKTVVIDLTKTEEELWKELSHGNRYNINFAKKKGVMVKEESVEKFNSLWELFQETAKKDKFHLHEKEYYEKLLEFKTDKFFTKLVVAYVDSMPASAAIIGFYGGESAYYLHSVSSKKFLRAKPAFILNWEIILNAKKDGYKIYDLWGVNAKRMPGVTKFKLSFGGRVIEYPGAFDLPISKFWYFVYKVVSKLF